MKHTAQSLGKYIGQRVRFFHYPPDVVERIDGVGSLLEVGFIRDCLCEADDTVYICKPENVTPILKTYEKLIEPMMFEVKEIIPIDFVYGYDPIGFEIFDEGLFRKRSTDGVNASFEKWGLNKYDPIMLNKLLALGFGAIKNEDSSTGYLSLFDGLECEVER